jgi:hypothetical protein
MMNDEDLKPFLVWFNTRDKYDAIVKQYAICQKLFFI